MTRKHYPNVWSLKALLEHVNTVFESHDGKTWTPSRPLGYPSLRHRFKAAWLVFTGKADVLVWPKPQDVLNDPTSKR